MLKIGAVFIPVKNIEKSISWYKETLDLELVGIWPDGNGADFYFQVEGQYVTLVKVKEIPITTFYDVNEFPNTFYNFTTNDLHSYHEQLRDKGVKVSEIHDYGPVIGFHIIDLDGNKISVIVDKDE